ncbi:glycoside hydrolase family 15 protein [Multifurca ochricompacta]|uniref:Glycoside hydrolase family 15 protein n=1 Tax=Multifurca ochricompacta TaxID=376703 RepID=A0AAD4QQ50_9AGAM|nr:glycoside hydrolase family 15 protein [Multifurca ochricompacta]
MNLCNPNQRRDYVPISDHALIGNLRTAALVSISALVLSYCVPDFDSPSVFARILDKDKGGHFSISPKISFTTKQNYLPSSNSLKISAHCRFLNEEGVVSVTDFLPRNPTATAQKPLLHWLIRRVEVVRGKQSMRMECAPAFNYALAKHHTSLVPDESIPANGEDAPNRQKKALFESDGLTLDLRFVAESVVDDILAPSVELKTLDLRIQGHKGISISADLDLVEGQVVTFVLRTPPKASKDQDISDPTDNKAQQLGVSLDREFYRPYGSTMSNLRNKEDPLLTRSLLHDLLQGTNDYWNSWIRKSTYDGSWKEAVHRSALALKLLIYEPTGAAVASPTFSLPEFIGGTRNWDYRASWIRDASFTLYALIRLGFTHEADAYMEFIYDRLKDRNPDGSLQIMYTIHGWLASLPLLSPSADLFKGEKIFPEKELTHLDGHKGSKPVRIGNGAIDHIQLDIYGELMDCIYLGQKFGKPLAKREVVDDVLTCDILGREVRNKKRHFTLPACPTLLNGNLLGLRLAEKRSLPCPRRNQWLEARDELYEQIMQKAWNPTKKFFAQSYDEIDILDSAVLIMPLVFFSTASDPRFRSTLDAILKSPERGGLTANNLVYRYNTAESDDGVGGEEGTFCLCTLWCIEALTRAGQFDKAALQQAIRMFEDFLQYLNHVGLCTEEISPAGDGLGNAVQGFTHVTLISTAFNLSRTMKRGGH